MAIFNSELLVYQRVSKSNMNCGRSRLGKSMAPEDFQMVFCDSSVIIPLIPNFANWVLGGSSHLVSGL